MNAPCPIERQRGVALVVALLFLLVVTIISVIAAGNSAIGLRMSANLQDAYSSFQSAEGGIIAALSLAGTGASDPFDRGDTANLFDSADPRYWDCNDPNNPLQNLNDGACSLGSSHLPARSPHGRSPPSQRSITPHLSSQPHRRNLSRAKKEKKRYRR